MKKTFTLLLVLLFCAAIGASAQAAGKRYAMYGVAFYNLENLFDTLHDAGKNDYQYLPEGSYKWNGHKYRSKLRNMSVVLSQLCTDRLKGGAAVVGVSEIENRGVLEDLLEQEALKERGWKIVHYDGPDRRGVECAFFYNPRLFQFEKSMLVPYYYKDDKQPDVDLGFYVAENGEVTPYEGLRGDTTHITRGFLVMTGLLGGERVHFIVNHWPSRGAASPARERAGYQVRRLKDALLSQDPESKIIIMGDMNDDPGDKSMTEALGCVHRKKDARTAADLYNPWHDTLYKGGQGTLLYNGKWNLFDQIVFSGSMLGDDRSTLKYYKHEIFLRDYLIQQDGADKGSPKRTHSRGVWLNGYSDHLPTQVFFVKEIGSPQKQN
ncbi:MAG: endonuclease/exonuclease/phosphatase family protein [Prevotellaceae bacterium]|nr:endonuclease/exonuclease/phosphatase family protein [Prevotellaceae bacterium]